MLELNLRRARNNKGVPWTVLPVTVTDLRVHVHDLRNAVWLTCRGGVRNSPRQARKCGIVRCAAGSS
jgi:hypothetical protein